MPQVPYSPVPTVAPTEVATPSERVSTPLEAFGGGVAAATEGLGKSVSGVGDELFARAVALQELNNETDAKNANVDFIGKAGDLHAKYNALQGQARVAAFPQYQKDLQTLYQTSRGSLSNPSAQRMFDGAAISTLNRSVFNAAGSAATAQSEAALGAANAEFETTVKGVYNDPNDQGAYDDAIAKSDKAAVTKAALSPGGASPERVAYIQQQGRSTITYNRVVGMAADEPNKAYQFLKEAEAKGMIFGAQDTEALAKVRSFIHSVGMNTVANQTLAKYTQPDGTVCTLNNDERLWFYWLCALEMGFQYQYPELLMPILHLVDGSGSNSTVDSPVCGTQPAYAAQTYSDDPVVCQA